jgi:hypothetical protein
VLSLDAPSSDDMPTQLTQTEKGSHRSWQAISLIHAINGQLTLSGVAVEKVQFRVKPTKIWG